MLTQKQCDLIRTDSEKSTEKVFSFVDSLTEVPYSEDMILTTIDLLMTIPKDKIMKTLEMFSRVAEKKLPEKEFHLEISNIYKQMKG